MLTNLIVLLVTGLMLVILFQRRVLQSPIWRATVTPLASIIGSGFLILGPILERDFGYAGIFVLGGLCSIAYGIGAAIRFNILEYDRADSDKIPNVIRKLESVSAWALMFAYVISVSYYLNLFGAFAVALTPFNSPLNSRIAASLALLTIGAVGWLQGLSALERLEEVAVGLKLAIIAGFLAGLAWFVFGLTQSGGLYHNDPHEFRFQSIAIALGLVITVQGFETSRYLGSEYDAQTRVETMKYSQWISTAIYLTYIVLVSFGFSADSIETTETAIIDMSRAIASLLPVLLVVAALAAQFSAAVADTGGSGGLAEELSNKRISPSLAYLLVCTGGLAITWTTDIYQIISFASRAFAVYYFLQVMIAICFSLQSKRPSWLRIAFFSMMALIALAIVVFGQPAEG